MEGTFDSNVCACGLAAVTSLGGGRGAERQRCRQCGLLSREAMPPEADQLQWYRKNYGEQFCQEQLGTARENVCRHVMDRIRQGHPGQGLLVDVGCGPGGLLNQSNRCGWRSIGFELSRSAVSLARSQGFHVYEQSWVPCPLPDVSADAVTFINVLDHLVRPFDALREAWRVLRPGGQIYIRVPNAPLHESLSRFFAHCGLAQMTVMHLYGFGRRALSFHLGRLGFESIDVRTSPPTRADAYALDGTAQAYFRRFAKQADRAAYRVARETGMDRWGWGLSIEAIARKPLVPMTES